MKRFICICLCFIFLSTSILCGKFNKQAHADSLTVSMVGAAAAALMSDWGISFTSVNADASNMQTVFDSRVEEYVNSHGGSLQGLFGYEVARSVAGKLVVGYELYNGIIDFVDYVTQTYSDVLSFGNYGDDTVPSYFPAASVDVSPTGVSVLCTNYVEDSVLAGFKRVRIYRNGSNIYDYTSDGYNTVYTGSWSLVPDGTKLFCNVDFIRRNGSTSYTHVYVAELSALNNKLNFDDTSYVEPTVLNPDKGWSGTIGGQALPDTNLDQLIGEIYDGIAENDVDIVGEIIDVVVPPEPVDPDTPLSDVPWGEVDDPLTDIDTNIGDIADTFPDIIPAIESQTETLESIEEALEDEEINWPKFDLRGLFPFCIPFDIYAMLQALDASPVAPRVQIPFVIQSIGFSYIIDFDFSAFDSVAAIMRQMELIVYGIALAWATSKVIKW